MFEYYYDETVEWIQYAVLLTLKKKMATVRLPVVLVQFEPKQS